MASNKTVAAEEKVVETPIKKPAAPAPVQARVYTAAELADNYRAFNTTREIVVVARRKAGKETATLAEAKTIIEKFKNREVK